LKTGQNWQSLNCKEQLILFVDTLLEKSKTYFQFFLRYGNRLRKTAFAIIGGRNPGDQRHQQAPPRRYCRSQTHTGALTHIACSPICKPIALSAGRRIKGEEGRRFFSESFKDNPLE
jgi:hypothetical protein